MAEMNLAANIALQANYALEGRCVFQGMNISIENKKGSTRSGVGKDGKPWSVTMTHPYGYIRMSKGVDGDHVDCFIGPNEDADTVYVIHTTEPTTGKYDEDKCMLGFDSADAAKRAFLANYSSPKFFGSMEAIPMAKFKEKVLATKDKPAKITAASQFGNTGWQYGRSIARQIGYVPARTYSGFPTAPRGGSRGIGQPRVAKAPSRGMGSVKGPNMRRPNPSGHAGLNVRKPNASFHHTAHRLEGEALTFLGTLQKHGWEKQKNGRWNHKEHPGHTVSVFNGEAHHETQGDWMDECHKHGLESEAVIVLNTPQELHVHLKKFGSGVNIKADFDGEPMAGNMGHAHIDPVTWFHPPSLTQRRSNESLRIPSDNPGEKNDKFLDKTKRDSKDTQEFRMKLLKRAAPGGLPAQIPARTTLIAPHTATYMPTGTGMYGAARAKRSARLGYKTNRGMFTSFKNQGRI